MSKVLVEESNLSGIASAIRSKLDVQTTYKPSQMAAAIGTIHGEPVLETLTATVNDTYTPSSGKDGFSQVTVNVPSAQPTLVTKSINANGTYAASGDSADGYRSVTVNVPNSYVAGDEGKVVSSGALVAQTARASEITANGTYDTTLNDEVVVSVAPNLQSKTVTQNGTITPDQGYDGLSSVVVNVSGGGSAIPDLVLMDASVTVSGGNLLALIPYAEKYQLNGFYISTQNGRRCWFRNGYGVTTNIIITKISAGLYRKLYVKAQVWVYGAGWQQAKVFLSRSVAMSGNQPSTAFKTVVLASQDYTPEQINAQAGVVINSTANNQLAYQTVEIDISDVNEDFYIGFWNCDLNMYITDIYLEA